VVVDSSSADGTQEIARGLGATVVDFKWNGQFPKKKNWALASVPWRNAWVFILDADERINPALAEEIHAVALADGAGLSGYYVNRRFYFLDGWLNHCGYYPSWNLRLFRHAAGRYEQFDGVSSTDSGDNEVHEHVIINGPTGRLQHEMEHYAFPTIDAWVEKHNRYSNWEARLLTSIPAMRFATHSAIEPVLARKRRLRSWSARMPFRPALRFLYHYVLRRGFLDGHRGFVFCRLMGFYEFLSINKAKELRLRGLGKRQG
jgi:glycosyltransferase involved in cell wall biosynthesis